MTHGFDKDYWEQHWQGGAGGSMAVNPPNPYLAPETADLVPGTALDAGCGSGAEALWLATQGWQVTAADISAEALAAAAARAAFLGITAPVSWIEADLTTWEPAQRFDLVTTHYAHPSIPQLEFYDRVATWVAPGGTLLIVGHLANHEHGHSHGHGHGHNDGHPPAEATATAETISARLDPTEWEILTATEAVRALPGSGGDGATLNDVVVRAKRRS